MKVSATLGVYIYFKTPILKESSFGHGVRTFILNLLSPAFLSITSLVFKQLFKEGRMISSAILYVLLAMSQRVCRIGLPRWPNDSTGRQPEKSSVSMSFICPSLSIHSHLPKTLSTSFRATSHLQELPMIPWSSLSPHPKLLIFLKSHVFAFMSSNTVLIHKMSLS